MTGKEFSAGLASLGLSQEGMADIVGCDSATIAAMCQADIVDPLYADDLIGLLAEKGVLEKPEAPMDETDYLVKSPANAHRIDAALSRIKKRS